jgi:nucleotide-binding universal stress UspA family protein
MFEKILVPLDGSKIAEQVLPYTIELARFFGSQVNLLGVCEAKDTKEGQACEITIRDNAEELNKQLTGTAASVKTIVLSGLPARKIVEYADNNQINLIMMTSYGRSGIGPWSLGSTVHKVLNLKLQIPILVVRPVEGEEFPTGLFNRIILPLDGSIRGEAPLPYVIEIAKRFETEIFLVQSIELQKQVHGGFSGLINIRFEDKDVEVAKQNAKTYLQNVAARFASTKASINIVIRTGEAAQEIIKLAEEKGNCLIAIGSHGHSGIDAWMYGSVSQKIINASKKSFLIIRSI